MMIPLESPGKTRREVQRRALAALAAPAAWIMERITSRASSAPEARGGPSVTIPIPKATSFQDRFVVVVRTDGSLSVLSSRCTHLGCRIHTLDGDNLVCPCHGSRFSAAGELLRGPATRSLPTLPYELDRARNELKVYV